MKPARLKKSITVVSIVFLYINLLVFFSSFSSPFWLNTGFAVAVLLSVYVIRNGKSFLPSHQKLFVLFCLGVFILASLIHNFSFFYKQSVVKNWEDNIKVELQNEASEIQEDFISLQYDIERKAAALADAVVKAAGDQGNETSVKGKIVSELNAGSAGLLKDEFLFGASLYDSSRSLISWWGNESAAILPPVSTKETRDSIFFNTVDEVRSYISNIRIIRDKTGKPKYYLIVNRLLRTDYRIHNRFLTDYDYFKSDKTFKLNVILFDLESTEAQSQWENLFYRNRDSYWGHSEEETKTLTVPLKTLSLEIIGSLSLTSTTLGEDIHRISAKFIFLCSSLILLLPLVLIIYLLRKYSLSISRSAVKKPKQSRNQELSPYNIIWLLWVFRLSVSLLGYPSRFIDVDLFKPTLMAIDIFNIKNSFLDDLLNFYVSPFDMFLTVMFILLTLLIVNTAIKKKTDALFAGGTGKWDIGKTKRILFLVVSLTAGSGIIFANLALNHSFLKEFYENIRLDVLWSSFADMNITKLIIQISLVGCATAFALVIFIVNTIQLLSLNGFMRRSFSFALIVLLDFIIGLGSGVLAGFRSLSLIGWLTVFAAPVIYLFFNIKYFSKPQKQSFLFLFTKPFMVIFLAVLSQTSLSFNTFQLQQEMFIEKNLVNRLSEQKEWNIIIMKNALEQYSRDRVLMTKLKNRAEFRIEALAYSLWSRLDPALKGYNTSLEIRDNAGGLIDRFSINPLYNNQDLTPQQTEPRIILNSKWINYDNRNIEILVGQAICKDGDTVLAKILLCYAFDYNYIFLPSTRNPYYELFRATDETLGTESLFSRNLFFMVYDREGNYKTGSEDFSLPMGRNNLQRLQKLSKSEWLIINNANRYYKLLAFRQGDDVFLLGYPVPKLLDFLFYVSEVFGICFFAAILTLLVFGIFRIDLRRRKISDLFGLKAYLGMSYVRLLGTFIIVSIIPIVFLAVFAYEHLSGMMSAEVESRGINSLKVVKRFIDLNTLYGRVRDENTITDIITDPLVSDIGKWINRDLNIYYGRHLIATNKQELYFSRLLPPVLNSSLYEKLMFKKELQSATEDRIGDLSYLVVGTIIPTENPQKPLIITIPLMTEQNRIKQELSDFLRLIIFIVIVLINVFFLLSHWLALQIARPIHRLTEGAERIASGDYTVKLTPLRNDEIGSLMRSFNAMTHSLAEQREELFKKTRDLESILSYASTGVISFTPSGRIVTINPAALKVLRLDGETKDYIGTELVSIFQRKPAFKDLHISYDEYKRNMRTSLASDLRMTFKEGTEEKEVVANMVITPMWNENHSLYASLMIIEDVTQIIRSKRLEAWAEMARIIAHEIKNPLTPIQLAAQHLQVVIKDRAENLDEISDDCLTTILQKVTELKQFSDDFWHYSELPKLSAEPLNIAAFIDEVVSPYAIAPPEGVKLKVELPPKPPLVMIDKKLMKQTFINLIENSYHAMHGGGALTIKVDYGRERRKAGLVEISVADTGIGIKEDDLKRVFEPYFSTKEKGVGLGLAIAKKTIEEHQGTISIESSPGKGAVVRVLLHVHEGKQT